MTGKRSEPGIPPPNCRCPAAANIPAVGRIVCGYPLEWGTGTGATLLPLGRLTGNLSAIEQSNNPPISVDDPKFR
jgi:hypothetical protein